MTRLATRDHRGVIRNSAVANSALSIVLSVASLRKGYDVAYQPGAVPLTTLRKTRFGAFIMLGIVAIATDLYDRRTTPVNQKTGLSDTRSLIGNNAGSVLAVGTGLVELLRGKSLVKGYPFSRVGVAVHCYTVAVYASSLVEPTRELSRRYTDYRRGRPEIARWRE